MAGFGEAFTLIFTRGRYRKSFAKFKGARDSTNRLPRWAQPDEIAGRIVGAGKQCREEYRDLPTTPKGVREWVNDHRVLFLGYIAELQNSCQEVVYQDTAHVHRRDVPLKTKLCITQALIPGALKAVDEFQRLFPGYRSWRLLPPIVYHIVVTAMAIAELPINTLAFRLFGENELLTTAVALVVAIAIPVTGHWIGVTLKRPFKTNTDIGLMMVSFPLVVSAILGIGRIRAIYFARAQITNDPAVEMYFYAFQFAFFAISIFLAYCSSDMLLELKERHARLIYIVKDTRQRRSTLRKRVRGNTKSQANYFDTLKTCYANANAENGGPLSLVTDVPPILVRIPADLEEVDEECPVPIEERLKAGAHPAATAEPVAPAQDPEKEHANEIV